MASAMRKMYSDPAGLLDQAAADRHVWRRAWLLNASSALIAPALLGVAASLSGRPWIMMLSYAALAIVPIMLSIGIAVPTTGQPQFWMIYLSAPPVMLTALLAGLGMIWPGNWVLSGVLGVPLLIGVLISCACAIWAYNRTSGVRREYTRLRQTGPPADLPALAFQNHARMFRCIAAVGLALLAFAAQLLFWSIAPLTGLMIGLAVIVCAGACLRAEAALLCRLGQPLVARDTRGAWHVTYAGRWALFAPKRAILPLLTGAQPAAYAGAALMALLHEGCLGPVIRRCCAGLSPAQAERLALSLSLQPGGAGAILYLAPALPPPIQAIVLTYARLAQEAARPPDLRRWLAALTDQPGLARLTETGLAPELAHALAVARAALACYAYDPVLEEAARHLRQIFPVAYGDTSSSTPTRDMPERWPEALQEHIKAHGRLLGTNQITESHDAESS